MNRLIFVLIGILSLSSYAGASPTLGNLHTPKDVDSYLKNHLSKKTLKQWDNHVSDDTVIIDLSTVSDNTHGTAK